jgi:sporulation protein YabP
MENNESMGRHTVTIEDRKRIKINCVEDVESFNEEKVVVYTSMGVMIVSGFDFKVNRLSVEDGQLIIDGEVVADNDDRGGSGFFGKLFR